jgi:hypothetical protein
VPVALLADVGLEAPFVSAGETGLNLPVWGELAEEDGGDELALLVLAEEPGAGENGGRSGWTRCRGGLDEVSTARVWWLGLPFLREVERCDEASGSAGGGSPTPPVALVVSTCPTPVLHPCDCPAVPPAPAPAPPLCCPARCRPLPPAPCACPAPLRRPALPPAAAARASRPPHPQAPALPPPCAAQARRPPHLQAARPAARPPSPGPAPAPPAAPAAPACPPPGPAPALHPPCQPGWWGGCAPGGGCVRARVSRTPPPLTENKTRERERTVLSFPP